MLFGTPKTYNRKVENRRHRKVEKQSGASHDQESKNVETYKNRKVHVVSRQVGKIDK